MSVTTVRVSAPTATISVLCALCACSRGSGPGAAQPAPVAEAASQASAPSPAPVAAGTYWPERACVRLADPSHHEGWNWCVESVTLRPGGELVFRCLWEADESSRMQVQKGPDVGNRKMYVVDRGGRRPDHVGTTEAARLGGTLSTKRPTMRGDFVFRPAVVDPPFTFHDDDQSVAIADIPLDPAQRSDGAGPADPRLRAPLDQIRRADEVQIDDRSPAWESGLGSATSCAARHPA